MDKNTIFPCQKEQLIQYRNEAVMAYFAKSHSDLCSSEIACIFEETKKVLYIASLSEKPLAPKPHVEEMWATFVLFSEDYRRFCHTYFDGFIEYIPPKVPVTKDMRAYTEALLKQHFPPQAIAKTDISLNTLNEDITDLKDKFDGVLFIMLSLVCVSIIAVIFAATIPLEDIETFFFGKKEICSVKVFMPDEQTFDSKIIKWTDTQPLNKEESIRGNVEMSLTKKMYKKEKGMAQEFYINLKIAYSLGDSLASIRFANGKGWAISVGPFKHSQTCINIAIDLPKSFVKGFMEKKPKYIFVIDNQKREFKIEIPEEKLTEIIEAFECTYLLQLSDEKINKL